MRLRAARTLAFLLIASVALITSVARAQQTTLVPVSLDGQTVRLEMRVYTPAGSGRVPTLVFHHGSAGRGTDARLFARPVDFPKLARFFVDRGWAVVMPARRGRAGSEGRDEEGVEANRAAGYSCDAALSTAGAERALRDVEAAMIAILAMPFVDRDRVVIGGQSRGGILSIVYAARHPGEIKGVINFAGGWIGMPCGSAPAVNQSLARRGSGYPGETLWLYGESDPYFPLAHSRDNFDAFRKAGGTGFFHELVPPPGRTGHDVVAVPALWGPIVDAYLARLGLQVREDHPARRTSAIAAASSRR